MRRDEIRAAVRSHLAQKGYVRAAHKWPKPGRLYIEIDGYLRELHMPAPMPKYRFRAIMKQVPRIGPPVLSRIVSARSLLQPELPFMAAA